MAGRFGICVYNFLETRSTLGEPQLADSCWLRTRAHGVGRVAMYSDNRRGYDTRNVVAAGCAGTRWCSFWRGSNDSLGSSKPESNARAIARAESKNKMNGMKTIVQIANVARGTISLRNDSVLVCRVQSAARCASRPNGCVVCYLA